MDTWVKLAAGVATVLSLLVLLGGAWALVRGSFNKARVAELREDNDDLRARMKDCEGKISDLQHAIDKRDQTIGHQQTEIQSLTALITQRAEVEVVAVAVRQLMERLDQHHTEAMSHWSTMETLLEGKI